MLTPSDKNQPVTIIVPMLNEEAYITGFLTSLAQGSYPHSLLEVLILDGMSTDQSLVLIEKFQLEHPTLEIKIIENKNVTIPNALNLGIQHSQNELIVRVDCHAEYHKNYILNSVKNLLGLPSATGVGGVISPKGISPTGRAIALALKLSIGNGGANYRSTSTITKSDTIWCGCWRRSDAIKVGLFDSTKEANEDFEFNQRLRQIGNLYTCPDIIAVQYVRESFSALYSQYQRYGFWKATVVKAHPDNFQLRQIIPFMFFVSLGLSILFVSLSPWPLLVLSLSYFTAIALSPIQVKVTNIEEYLKISFALVIMHCAWFIGTLKGLFSK